MAAANIAQKQSASETLDNKPFLIRSPSASSDVTVRSVANISVPPVNPAPVYVAQRAASELVSAEIDRTVFVSGPALTLINEFLDQVIYNILLTSRSTSLGSLRAAVSSVLRPRLGKAALKVAEEELKEYLDDDEETELHARPSTTDLRHDFDPDLAWKLARLRCMVYTRLGDLEEEDEEEWLEKEGLRTQLQNARQYFQAVMETGPASAIFLTSIIEYLGEQALYYAAQHAQKRHYQHGGQRTPEEEIEFADIPATSDDIIIGGKDMNHVGRDSPLSRLWRSYRRNTRESGSRPMSPEFRGSRGFSMSHSRNASILPHETVIVEESRSPDQIPLPMSGNDIDEIEVPGLAPAFSDEEDLDQEDSSQQKRRPASMIVMPGGYPGFANSVNMDPPEIPEKSPLRPIWLRKRSISSPVTTLGKINSQSQGSSRRTEPVVQENAPARTDRSALGAGKRSASYGNTASEKANGIVGGAIAAVAGALGLGGLGISQNRAGPSDSPPDSTQTSRADQSTPTIVQPKKTVAEEMLGTTPSVAPPKDAQTGSSITNVSDFYSMHVPVAMSPGSQVSQGSITPLASKEGGYFPGASKSTKERSRHNNPSSFEKTDGVGDSLHEDLRPAPLRTLSGRVANTQPITGGYTYKQPIILTQDTSNLPPHTSDLETPVSVSTADSRPESSGSAILGTAVSAVPHRGTLTDNVQLRQGQSNTLESPLLKNVPASRGSSETAKDVHGRSPTSQHSRMTGVPADETKSVHSATTTTVSRDLRPGTSNSTTKRLHGKPAQLVDESDEAKKKSLEILIRGNETLHYTLTPAAAMRDEQSMAQKSRSQTQDMAEFIRNSAPPAHESTTRSKISAPNNNTLEPPKSPSTVVQRIVTPSSPRGVITPVSPTRAKNPLGEPRDARYESIPSTRDLADYARSTGPMDVKQLPQSLGSRAAKQTSPRSVTAPPRPESLQRESSTGSKPANRLKYQARDARPSRNNETTELIDFIREGPPTSAREHRIDRRVAPFRTTMDSEDFNNLAGGREMVSSLRESEDGHPAPSVDPSVTSQTPLIVSNGQVTKAAAPVAPVKPSTADSDEMPKRTRRRIKDPYAIYDSDDDDDQFDDDMPSRSRNQEESLIDFLRNTAPPASMTTQPILGSRGSQHSSENLRASGARASSPHLTQSGTKADKYRPTQPTHAAHVERNRANPSMRASEPNLSRPRSRFEARDAKASRTGTSELAQYLRDSGPAPNAEFKPQPFILSTAASQPPKAPTPPVKEDKSIFKRFSKSKK